jgi:hypothetical protein
VGFSRENQASGDRAWGRITGFSGAANAFAWAATRFKDAGLKDVQLQEYDGAAPGMWQATGWDARVLPVNIDPANVPAGLSPTPFDGMQVPVALGSASCERLPPSRRVHYRAAHLCRKGRHAHRCVG